jgi:threo-3-hydroxy-L-aspartate ammonia-lyase
MEKNPGLTLTQHDHFHVIAGQGTITKELLEEVGHLDHLFVCVGGGSNLPGAGLVVKALCPTCQVHGVEPEGGDNSK